MDISDINRIKISNAITNAYWSGPHTTSALTFWSVKCDSIRNAVIGKHHPLTAKEWQAATILESMDTVEYNAMIKRMPLLRSPNTDLSDFCIYSHEIEKRVRNLTKLVNANLSMIEALLGFVEMERIWNDEMLIEGKAVLRDLHKSGKSFEQRHILNQVSHMMWEIDTGRYEVLW